jgi:Carbohydrate family 9 binding domain-like
MIPKLSRGLAMGNFIGALILQIILLLTWTQAASAQTLPSYSVYRTPSPITIDGKLNERAWHSAPVAGDFHFNWWEAGEKEQTVVRMLWDDQNLYVSYYCYDKHTDAKITESQGPVSTDDSIEFYARPNPDKLDFNGIEINSLCTLLGYRVRDGKDQQRWQPEGVRCKTASYPGHWIMELAIPLKNYSDVAAHTPPHNGDRWRVNLNRIDLIGSANATHPQYQYSTWSPVHTPRPNFHVPEAFGWVKFVDRKPPTHSPKAK